MASRVRARRLSSQIFAFQALILAGTLLIGFLLAVYALHQRIDDETLERGLGIAQAVATMPEVVEAIEAGDMSGIVQERAEAVRKATGVTAVTIADRRGIRYAHPVRERIGTPVSVDPAIPLSGRTELVITTGSLGPGARARIPLRNAQGAVIGMVAVTVLRTRLTDELESGIPVIALYTGIALAIGLAASLLLTRLLKRQTFGLELGEITQMLREREAMLRGIREGVVAVDAKGRVQVVNREAQRLLALPGDAVGRPVVDLAGGRLGDLLAGRLRGKDLLLVHGDRLLVASRMPVRRDGRDLGAVVTLRDRTELESLARELDSVRGLTDAMRAQAHEFSNRLHTISGLLQLSHHAEALDFVKEITRADAELRRTLGERVADPRAAALLLAKSAVANERGAELRLGEHLRLDGQLNDPPAVLTVLGNLIDNALDAARTSPAQLQWVEVHLTADDDGTLFIRVADSGPGVAPDAREKIFEPGWSTKPPTEIGMRGVGLSLVRRTVERRGGSVALVADAPGQGAVFEVCLPDAVSAVPESEPEVLA
jgi:two-component system CitB family sensor kinase